MPNLLWLDDSRNCWYFQHFTSSNAPLLVRFLPHTPVVADEPEVSVKGNLILICDAFVHLTSGWSE
jgi:hypothetical protein